MRIVLAVLLTGTTIKWLHFHSRAYPYAISQPSSFVFQPLENTAHQAVDCFFPVPLGSFVTSVCIYADHVKQDPRRTLAGLGGTNIHKSATVTIMGKKHSLIAASFKGVPFRFIVEKVDIAVKGLNWHLTISNALPYRKKQRPLMLHMLRTFHVDDVGKRSSKPKDVVT